MAKRKSATKAASTRAAKKSPEELVEMVKQYEGVFGEIGKFIAIIHKQESEIVQAQVLVTEAKQQYEDAKAALDACKQFRDGAKHSLYKFLSPGVTEILPLFDTMEPADEDIHGLGAKEWRNEPLAVLKLSLPSVLLLNEADILFVGQLQDRILAAPHDWWEKIEGLTAPVAAAIVDRLNDFTNDQEDDG